MKNILSLFLIILIGNNIFSQENITINWSETIEISDKLISDIPTAIRLLQFKTDIINADDKSIFILKSGRRQKDNQYKREYTLERYNTDWKLELSKVLDIPVSFDGGNINFYGVYYINGQLYLLCENVGNKVSILLYDIDIDGNVSNNYKLLSEREKEGYTPMQYGLKISPNNSKILIYDIKTSLWTNHQSTYRIYNEKFDLLKEKQIAFSEKYLHAIKSYNINNHGDIIINAEGSNNEKANYSKPECAFIIYNYSDDLLKEVHLQIPDYRISNFESVFNETNRGVHIVGLYADLKNNEDKGYFIKNYDLKTTELLYETQHTFNNTLLSEIIGARKANKTKDLLGFESKNVFINSKNELIFLCEENILVENSYRDIRSSSGYITKSSNSNGNVLVLKLSSLGDFIWFKTIPKKSTGGFNFYNSFYTFYNQKTNNLALLFNDHIDNPLNVSSESALKIFSSPKKSMIIGVIVSDDGKIKREKISVTDENGNTALAPSYTFQKGNGDLIIFCAYEKQYRYGVITIK